MAQSAKEDSALLDRIGHLFSTRKLPAWVLLVFLIFNNVPEWKEHLDFWIALAKEAGGTMSVIAHVLLWPYFNAVSTLGAVVWLVFIGEPRQSLRHPRWQYVGWIAVLAFFGVMVWVVGNGYIQSRVTDELTNRAAFERHLTDQQKSDIKAAFMDTIKPVPYLVVSTSVDPESVTYAQEWMNALLDAGVALEPGNSKGDTAPDLVTIPSTTPHGMLIGVRDKNHPPPEAQQLKSVMEKAGFATQYESIHGMPWQSQIIVGLK
jgi:hypothetical protein